jgi:hypothetical protein
MAFYKIFCNKLHGKTPSKVAVLTAFLSLLCMFQNDMSHAKIDTFLEMFRHTVISVVTSVFTTTKTNCFILRH